MELIKICENRDCLTILLGIFIILIILCLSNLHIETYEYEKEKVFYPDYYGTSQVGLGRKGTIECFNGVTYKYINNMDAHNIIAEVTQLDKKGHCIIKTKYPGIRFTTK